MPNLNKVMLMGNLTRDPELRYTQNNTAVCQIGMAINRKWKDPNGETKEEVTFIDAEAWGRTAEVINQYLRKGRPLFVEGRLRLDQWQDKEGNNRSKIKVVVESFEFIDSKTGGGGEGGEGGSYGGSSGGPDGGGNRSYNRPPQNQQRPPQQRSAGPGPTSNPLPQSQPPMDQHQPMDDENIPF
jgi:single-strand DNA-binding protein